VPIEDVVAVFRRTPKLQRKARSAGGVNEVDDLSEAQDTDESGD
jgi:hypothetical protein